jgi:hypothetical protein
VFRGFATLVWFAESFAALEGSQISGILCSDFFQIKYKSVVIAK